MGRAMSLVGEVIAIGDELVSGQRLDTNSRWISAELGVLGIPVTFHTTAADTLGAGIDAFRIACARADIVIATGGLGPTADDLTRDVLAAVAGVPLEESAESLLAIEARFARRGAPMPASNRRQAAFPAGSRIVPNPHGTAPGIDVDLVVNGHASRVFALPGVPAEMRVMWRETVVPALIALRPDGGTIVQRRIKCFGAGESAIEARLPDLVRRGREPTVGITAHEATITLRIAAAGADAAACLASIAGTEATIRECLGDLVYGVEDDEVEDAALGAVAAAGARVAVAEIATEGRVAALLAQAQGRRGREVLFAGGIVHPPGHDAATAEDLAGEARRRFGAAGGARGARGGRDRARRRRGVATHRARARRRPDPRRVACREDGRGPRPPGGGAGGGSADAMTPRGRWESLLRPGDARTIVLFSGLVALVAMLVWPSFVGRLQYARTRAELRAIRDAAKVAELSSVGKLFTTLARVVGPAVVNVTSKRRILVVADEIAALRGGGTMGATDEVVGSGVLVAADGVVVTNYHVVARSDTIEVALADGRRFAADLVGADAATDLAVLRIDAGDLPTAVWGDSDTVEVGEMVWAFGNPFGLDRTLTYGIVSGVGRRGVAGNPLQEFLQTDASINPGNSGGPLVDVHGHVMGITTAIVGRSNTGIGFAIPSNTARLVSEQILANGHVERGYVGMALRPVSGGGPGAEIVAVEKDSPAALAGLVPGDVVLAFEGDDVSDPAALVLMLTRSRVGTEASIDLLREGVVRTVPLRIGRRPRDL